MSAPTPTDFPGPDTYYSPEPGGLFFSLSPAMTATLVLLLGLAVLLGWLWGRSKRPGDDPSEAIYTAIKKALAEATGAPRDGVIAAGRKAQAVIKDQLGDVLILAKGLAGPYGALGPALEGIDKSPPKAEHKDHKPEAHAEKSGVEKVIIKARDVFISHAPAPDGHDDDHKDDHKDGHGKDDKGHGDKPASGGHGGGHGAGHGGGDHAPKPMSAQAQIEAVRAAVHNLSDHWSDKNARLAELRAARKQLTRPS